MAAMPLPPQQPEVLDARAPAELCPPQQPQVLHAPEASEPWPPPPPPQSRAWSTFWSGMKDALVQALSRPFRHTLDRSLCCSRILHQDTPSQSIVLLLLCVRGGRRAHYEHRGALSAAACLHVHRVIFRGTTADA